MAHLYEPLRWMRALGRVALGALLATLGLLCVGAARVDGERAWVELGAVLPNAAVPWAALGGATPGAAMSWAVVGCGAVRLGHKWLRARGRRRAPVELHSVKVD